MIYPRLTSDNQLVADNQMVCTREHLTQKHRVLFVSGVFTSDIEGHNLLIALDSLSHDPIKLVITSPGGDLDSAFLFYDTIKLMKSPIWTLGRYAASAAAMILAAGGRRYLMPHAKVMLHLPANYFARDTAIGVQDMEIIHAQSKKYKEQMVSILQECGAQKSTVEILKDMDRDFWLEPKETIEYGLADAVMDKETMEEWLA